MTRPADLPVARALGLTRAALATAVLVAPALTVRTFGADAVTAARVTWLTRMLGVRDAAIAAGQLEAERRGERLTPWLVAGGVSDAVDAVVIAGALRSGRLRGAKPVLGVLAGASSAVVHAWAVREARAGR